MNILKTVTTTVFGLALMGAVFSPAAKADEWNRKTKITFSGPVEIPGVHLKGWAVLPAGTYVFKILDSQSDRHIVQIFSEDETTVYATILAIPNYRLKATDKTVMTFRERPAGEPEALRAWFYPGRNLGRGIRLSEGQSGRVGQDHQHADPLYAGRRFQWKSLSPILTADAPVVVQLKQAPVMAFQPTGEEVELAAVVTPPPAVALTADAAPTTLATLPATSSTLPLIAAFGLLALGGAFGVGTAAEARSVSR